MCKEYWPKPPEKSRLFPTGPPCQVVSVGIGNAWSFEDLAAIGSELPFNESDYSPKILTTWRQFAAQPGRAPPNQCVVHAHDATISLRRVHEEHPRLQPPSTSGNLHFHFGGLRGSSSPPSASSTSTTAASTMVATSSKQNNKNTRNTYGVIDYSSLLTLSEMVGNIGWPVFTSEVGVAQIDVLKIDCEGCEWDAFAQISRESPGMLARTSLVLLELHVATSMVTPTPSQFANLFEFLLAKEGFRLFYIRNNPGRAKDRNVVPFLKGKTLAGHCCYELALYRPARP